MKRKGASDQQVLLLHDYHLSFLLLLPKWKHAGQYKFTEKVHVGFLFFGLMHGCYAIFRIVVKSQRRTWEVGGFVWFQCHVHCKSGATTEQIIGLLLSAAVSDRWKCSIWSEQTHACTYSDEKRASMEVNDITSWAVTLLKKHKADCSWCYIAIILFHA